MSDIETKPMFLEQTMRWYGPDDPVRLSDIRQAGASGVVTALHHLPNGAIWEISDIKKRLAVLKKAKLPWSVVESLPVHEAIKTRTRNYQTYIENYKESLKNLATCGIYTICYNFMPLLDWTRTDLSFSLPNGGKALRFEMAAIVAFDVHILQRDESENNYTPQELRAGQQFYDSLSPEEKEALTDTILKGLPGAELGYTLNDFRKVMEPYKKVGSEQLAHHLELFLQEVIPLAADLGIKMCLHPDDPPFSIFGLPRVVSTAADLKRIFEAIPGEANGLTFCTGSFGVRADNKLVEMINEFESRIHFVHLRAIAGDGFRNFYEASHLEGDAPMYEVMKALVLLQQKRNRSIPMRPDHGHQLLDDLTKEIAPGYSAIGRLKGLAELRGLELGIARSIVT